MIPLLYTTHDRLGFTKETLPILFENTLGDVLFVIIDTGSSDGTIEYLRDNIEKIANEKKYLLFIEKDMSLSKAMAFFFDLVKSYEFEYAAKVDNDTTVPEDWLNKLLDVAKNNDIDILQSRHHIRNNNVKDWDEWSTKMEQRTYRENVLYFNDFVGGSGVVFKKKVMISFEKEYGTSRLHGWTQTQAANKNWKKAFYDGVFVKLLDMEDDNVTKYDLYPDYYSFTGRI